MRVRVLGPGCGAQVGGGGNRSMRPTHVPEFCVFGQKVVHEIFSLRTHTHKKPNKKGKSNIYRLYGIWEQLF